MAFTETVFTSFTGHFTQTIAAPTYLASSFGTLQAALDALEATGGTLTLSAGATYNTSVLLHIRDTGRFEIDGNGATIFANAAMSGSTDVFEVGRCRNFIIRDLTIDGNKNNRSSGTGMCIKLVEPNSTFVGGGGCSLIRVKAENSPEDGFRLTANISNPTDVDRIARNVLVYKCEGRGCARLGSGYINVINCQTLGGIYEENGKDFGKALPASGIDVEPNDATSTVTPGCAQLLFRGVTFKGNNKNGLQLSGTMEPRFITVEGCLFDGSSSDVEALPSGNLGHGAGLTCKARDVRITKNIFQNCDTHYDPLTASGVFMSSATCIGSDVDDNLFINNTCTKTVISINNSIGAGNSCVNNRFSGNVGANVTSPNVTAGQCTISGNTNSAVPPSPLPPWDVTFAEDGEPTFPGGEIEFDAFSENSAENDLDFTHTPVSPPKGATIRIVQRGSSADEIATVTYGGVSVERPDPSKGPSFAADTASESGAAYVYHLGADVPTGPQTVSITKIPGAVGLIRAACTTWTADGDTAVNASGVVQENVANPTISLSTTAGLECGIVAALFSGRTAALLAVGADYTEEAEHESGGERVMSFMRRTANATGGTINADWVAATDDVAGVAVAISSVESTPENIILVQGLSRTRALGTAVVVLITSSVSLSIQPLPSRTRTIGTPAVNIQSGPVVVVPTGVTRTFRGLGSPNVVVTTPPLVTVIAQGLSRTRALGTSVVVVIEDNATVTPTGLSRAFRGIGAAVVVSTGTAINATVNVQGLARIREIGQPLVGLVTDVVIPVGYTVFTDEQMADRLLPGGSGALDPGVVRNSLMTLRDRVAHLAPSAGGPSYISLTAGQMTILLTDNTNSTVDSFVLRNVILSLRDRLTSVGPPETSQDNTYRILTNTEMETLLYDSTHGYIDAYILRSAILTLRDWIALVIDDE